MPRTGLRSLGGADTGVAAILERPTVNARPLFGPNEDRLAAVAGTHLDHVASRSRTFLAITAYVHDRNAEDLAAERRTQEGVAAAWVEPTVNPRGRGAAEGVGTGPSSADDTGLHLEAGFLEAAPVGVDARYAWSLDGGGGASCGSSTSN